MREIKLKIDKKYDVKRLLRVYLTKNNIAEFYEKKMKSDDKTIAVFTYEYVYRKAVTTPRLGVMYIDVTASTTIIVSEKSESTAVAIILSSDAKNDNLNSFDLMLKDYGFRYF